MQTFLSEVAQLLRKQHPRNLDQVWVVFNNRRPSLFLRKELRAQTEAAIFLPQMMGMDDLVHEMCQLEVVPNEFLLFELYKHHCELHIDDERRDSFEAFMPLADLMLADFSEIDLYKRDAKQIFSNLHQVKELMEWSVEGKALTPLQLNYLSFYKSLYSYYEKLHNTLLNRGQAYTGMAYRQAAEIVEQLVGKLPCKKIYFVGFNVLSTCEKDIINACLKRQTTDGEPFCEIITDGDRYYCDDTNQEAGRFLRELSSWASTPKEQPDHYGSEEKEITIVSCPENILQTKYAGDILAHILEYKQHGNSSLENTALVLADETLLLPMLNALPASVEKANITMGFPFTLSDIHSFVMKLFNLHIRKKAERFYHEDLLAVLTDGITYMLLGYNSLYSSVLYKLKKDRVIYATEEYIKSTLESLGLDYSLLQFLFEPHHDTPDHFLTLCETLIQKISSNEALKRNAKEREAAVCLSQIVSHLQEIQQRYRYIPNLQTLEKIYARLAQRHNVSFLGEPLGGLQILGMLETRNLDFDNLIMLSINEGSLPSGRSGNTLIPYDLKKAYQLPTYNEKDAVYAFHFYRLLQRARHITLIYNTETSGITKGEASRFILQIRDELSKRYPNIHVHEKVLSVINQRDAERIMQVSDNKQIKLSIASLSEHGFSATSLNTYRNCPRQFFYKYILSLHDKQELSDDLDHSEVGTAIHEILKQIYPAKGDIHAERLQEALNRIDILVQGTFDELYQTGTLPQGRNRLYSEIAQSQIVRFLKNEIALLEKQKISIESLESQFYTQTTINGTPIRLEGRIDRIDREGDQLRIIDYKSGSVKSAELTADGDGADLNCSNKWFQIVYYAWLYSKTHPTDTPIVCGLIPLQSNKPKLAPAKWHGNRYLSADDLTNFESYLTELLRKILSPNERFNPCEDKKKCQYCPFASTCKK